MKEKPELLDTCAARLSRGTYQKSISQPAVEEEHEVWNNAERLVVDEPLVSKRSGGCIVGARELSVINVGHGLKVEAHCGVYGREREHGGDEGDQTPVNSPLDAVVGAEQRAQALEEQDDDDS